MSVGDARHGNRLVERPALAVAEEDGDGHTGGIARIPDVPRSFSHPAGGLAAGKGRSGYRVFNPVVHDGKVLLAVGGSEAQYVAPKRLAERN